jgi:hypothetical protein
VGKKPIEVYCDGGIWIGTMTDAVTARSSDYVGRTVVVIPDLDYGIVQTFYDSDSNFGLASPFIDTLALPNGHENSFYAEIMAVRHADEACKRNGLTDGFVIYTDNGGAVKESPSLCRTNPAGKMAPGRRASIQDEEPGELCSAEHGHCEEETPANSHQRRSRKARDE